jgi:general secretion pathway protein H
MKTKHNGYTLIEILVVLLIISIVTSVAMLNIGQNKNKQLETFANELTQIVTLAEEQAMLQPMVLGLSFNERSMQFSSFKNTWRPLQDAQFSKHGIPNNIQINVQGGAKSGPEIIISSNGDITPFTIYLSQKGKEPRYVIKGEADGTVTNTELS